MFKEFRAFVNQGNAMDLAIGVIIGAAFAKIVNSVVNDIIMPIMSLALGKVDFQNMYISLAPDKLPPVAVGQAVVPLEEARKAGAVIAYGSFLNVVVEFLVVAFTIFLIVKQINKFRAAPAAK